MLNEKLLKWFTDNYEISNDECLELIVPYYLNSNLNFEDMKFGCEELSKIDINKEHTLATHLRVVKEVNDKGFKGNKAIETFAKLYLELDKNNLI